MGKRRQGVGRRVEVWVVLTVVVVVMVVVCPKQGAGVQGMCGHAYVHEV